jgi:hypothetical protein
MKKIAIVAVTLLAALACPQDRMGKSCDEIVGMGLSDWTAWYCNAKKDTSELAEDIAATVFAGCMREGNETTQAMLGPSDRERMQKYRKLATGFRLSVNETARMFAGGGTMFSHASARGAVSDEELMAKLIAINSRVIGPYTIDKRITITDLIGKVRKLLANTFSLPDARKKKMREMGVDWHKPAAELKKAYNNYDTILDLMPRERQDECIAILEWYLDRVNRSAAMLK